MAVESWWAPAQVTHADSLVFYRMRGFPPWPGLVLPCKPRSYLQGPMNPLCPPEDAIFERVQNCIQRGKGMKLGDTIIARVRDDVPFGLNWLPDSLLPLPRKKEKAKILQVFQKHLEVRYKRSGITDTIPKSWGELLSQSVRQRQAAGYEPAVWQSETRAAKCGTWRSEVPSVVKFPQDSDSSEEEDEAVSDAEQEDPWEVEEEATSQDTSTEEDFPKAAPKPVPRASCGSAPRNIATPVANAVRRSVAAPVRLQGHMVPCYEQLESTETSFSPKGSEIEEARRLLGVASDASLADLNRTRRRRVCTGGFLFMAEVL
ncbi:unnamed protein product [Symbiodinium microadriaticum]|nr:unnamed protein product [Symbiodinium microadriaticum]